MTDHRLLAKLAIARKELALDESTYRAMLERITGQTSAKGLPDAAIVAVLEELKAKGWTPRPGKRAQGVQPRARQADHPVAKKARALWLSLWNLGEVEDSSEKALEAFATRQLGTTWLQWADQSQGYKLIEALKAWAERVGWSQDLAGVPPAQAVAALRFRLMCRQHGILGLAGEGVAITPEGLDAEIAMRGAEIRALKAGTLGKVGVA